jgi:hypothetical protein
MNIKISEGYKVIWKLIELQRLYNLGFNVSKIYKLWRCYTNY